MITVCTADHVPLFLEGMIHAFEDAGDIQVLWRTSETGSVIAMLERWNPAVLVASLELPADGGITLVRTIRQHGFETGVVLYGSWETASAVELAAHLHVLGVINRLDPAAEFVHAVRAVASGGEYHSSSVVRFLDEAREQRKLDRRLEHLTATELQVLTLLAGNRTSVQIADVMGISGRTVQKHRQNISRKLALSGTNALLRFAVEYSDFLMTVPDAAALRKGEHSALAGMRRSTGSRFPRQR